MYNILIFGDSISAGRKIEKIKSWPCLLAQFFDSKDKDFTLVHNLSIPGDSTNEVIERFDVEARARCRKIYEDDHTSIIFAIGINDTKGLNSKNNVVTKINNFRENINHLFKEASKYTDHIIFIGLTPVDESRTLPLGNVYFSNEKIKNYNEVIKEECQNKNIIFIDMLSDWLKTNYIELLTDDGLHPNEKGHRKIYDKVKRLYK